VELRGVIADPDTGEPELVHMRTAGGDGGFVKGRLEVRGGGTVVFVPGTGNWTRDMDQPTVAEIQRARDERVARRTGRSAEDIEQERDEARSGGRGAGRARPVDRDDTDAIAAAAAAAEQASEEGDTRPRARQRARAAADAAAARKARSEERR
jgi:hypothetical protein